ncbi:adenosylcobinamide-GDP ribazoletransferase [Nigerium massiliense]|uniref:adenosylcobinamide-GDP ribazoletransferase n=1 Tax=Nigerium massiliense TaxID=1522317 RepID=UPI00058EA849|nr:adenosylcobinamide-GDP ribazoletransferase [Nigerium massiliense]
MSASTRPGVARDGWRLALGTLTVLPTRPPETIDAGAAGLAMALAPIAVLPVALVAALLGGALAWLGLPALACGLVCVGALALGTRFLHADGLADTADGLGASWDRERALEVMRRGDIGPMGATTLIVVLGLQASCAGALLVAPGGWVAVAVAFAGSRTALMLGTRRGVPAARPEGLGATVAGTVPTWLCLVGWLVVADLAVLAAPLAGRPWWSGLLAAAAGAAAAFGVLAWVRRRLGGITGDVLGCLVEIATAVWLGVSLIGSEPFAP